MRSLRAQPHEALRGRNQLVTETAKKVEQESQAAGLAAVAGQDGTKETSTPAAAFSETDSPRAAIASSPLASPPFLNLSPLSDCPADRGAPAVGQTTAAPAVFSELLSHGGGRPDGLAAPAVSNPPAPAAPAGASDVEGRLARAHETLVILAEELAEARKQLKIQESELSGLRAKLGSAGKPDNREVRRRSNWLSNFAERSKSGGVICEHCGKAKGGAESLAKHLYRQHREAVREMPAARFL